ncbi:MAG: AAA family ATPase [Bacteroidota bacterium]
MEHIKNIEIKNFKSIRHAEIKDCRRINVFIGYPNVGKSNILEALGLFNINAPTKNFSSFVRMENLTTLFFDGNIDQNSEIRINFNHRYIISINGDHLHLERQYTKDSERFDQEESRRSTWDGPLQVPIEILTSFDVKELGKAIQNFKGKTAIEMRLGDILTDVKKYEFKKSVDIVQGTYNDLITPYGDNIFDVLSSNEKLRKEISDLFKPYDLRFSFDKGTRTFKILKNVGEDIFLMHYSMIADTLMRLIFYKTAILSNKENVLIFEEPEAHMFPPYISKFTKDVILNEDENQFFIATHSPYVLNDFMEELKDDELAIYLVSYKKESGETSIDKMTKEEMHEAYQFGYDFFLNMENFIPAN